MKKPQQVVRDGWNLECIFCKEAIRYTYLVNWLLPAPFFYSDKSNDVLLRKSDELVAQKLCENNKPELTELEKLWHVFLESAPPAPNGGHFSFWSNVKCPFCKKEFPYNNGIRDLNVRIYESKIVLIDGAIVVGDDNKETWQIKVNLTH